MLKNLLLKNFCTKLDNM